MSDQEISLGFFSKYGIDYDDLKVMRHAHFDDSCSECEKHFKIALHVTKCDLETILSEDI